MDRWSSLKGSHPQKDSMLEIESGVKAGSAVGGMLMSSGPLHRAHGTGRLEASSGPPHDSMWTERENICQRRHQS